MWFWPWAFVLVSKRPDLLSFLAENLLSESPIPLHRLIVRQKTDTDPYRQGPTIRDIWSQAGSADTLFPCRYIFLRDRNSKGHPDDCDHSLLCWLLRLCTRHQYWRGPGRHLGSNTTGNSHCCICLCSSRRPCVRPNCRWRGCPKLSKMALD